MRFAVVAGPDPARAFPAAALASKMVELGDDVLVLTGPRWLPRLQALGVRAEELPGSAGEPGSADELHYRQPAKAAISTPDLTELLRAFAPDLVVVDVQTLAGGFAAELLGLPWVQLHPHPLTFSGGSARLDARRRGSERSRDAPGRPGPDRQMQRELVLARSSLDLPPDGHAPLLHLVATLPALELAGADWPHNASVVGPMVWDPADHDLAVPEGTSPMVLVCPSTAAAGRRDLLPTALRGLRDVRVVGGVLEPYDGDVPQWASVGTGRLGPLLDRSAVVVSGGGHGLAVRALGAGVPLVLVPGDGAQLELARQIEALGAAVVVRRLSPRSLRRAVDKVLDDRRYATAAGRIERGAATADAVLLCHQMLRAHRQVADDAAEGPPLR